MHVDGIKVVVSRAVGIVGCRGGIVEFLDFKPSLVWLVMDLVATGTLAAAA